MSRTMTRMLALACSLGLAGAASASTETMKRFDELDMNADGVLSQKEASAEKDLDFAKADVNKDGWLDRAEYDAAAS